MRVRKADDDGAFHNSGDHRSSRRTDNAEFRCAEFAEYQQVVEDEIDKHCCDASPHRKFCLPGFPQGAGVDIQQCEQGHLKEHDPQVLLPVMQRGCQIQGILAFVDKQGNQLIPARQENSKGNSKNNAYRDEFKACAVPDTLLIALSEELGGENPGTGQTAEYHQIEDKQDLIDNSDTGHRFRTDPAHHDVVKQRYKIRDDILYQHRHHHGKELLIKLPASYIFSEHGKYRTGSLRFFR